MLDAYFILKWNNNHEVSASMMGFELIPVNRGLEQLQIEFSPSSGIQFQSKVK
jgi:hypothetical protein